MKCLTRIYIFCFLRFKNNLCLLICGISVTMVRFMQNRARRVFELTVKLLMFKCFHLLAVMYAFEIFLPVLCSCLNDTPTFTNNILVSIFCLHYPHSLLSLQVCTAHLCVCLWGVYGRTSFGSTRIEMKFGSSKIFPLRFCSSL